MTDVNKSQVDLVKDFMLACDQVTPDYKIDSTKITEQNIKDIKLRLKLILEELSEFYEACLDQKTYVLFKIHFSLLQQMTDLLDESLIDFDIVGASDSIVDLIYVTLGSAVAFGIPHDELFTAVHENNMTKVDPTTGKCIRNEAGKIMKPEGYQPVDLTPILQEHGLIK